MMNGVKIILSCLVFAMIAQNVFAADVLRLYSAIRANNAGVVGEYLNDHRAMNYQIKLDDLGKLIGKAVEPGMTPLLYALPLEKLSIAKQILEGAEEDLLWG